MKRSTYTLVERVIVALMLAGMVGMFQPFALELYRYGFLLLLVSTIGFIIVSHITPRPETPAVSPMEEPREGPPPA